MNVGDLATVAQGEIRLVAVPFASLLRPGEMLVDPATATMALWPYSPEPDANAANLVTRLPSISGSGVVVTCGGYGDSGFQAGAVYSLWVEVGTSLGQTLEVYGQISCDPNLPAIATSGAVEALAPTNISLDLSTFGEALL